MVFHLRQEREKNLGLYLQLLDETLLLLQQPQELTCLLTEYNSASRVITDHLTTTARAMVCVTTMELSGGDTPGRARSNDLAGRSTALARALPIALLCFGNSVNRK